MEALSAGGTRWLPVHLLRQFNSDADRLSHPSQREEVEKRAERAGLRVVQLYLEEEDWEALHTAIAHERECYLELCGQGKRKRGARGRGPRAASEQPPAATAAGGGLPLERGTPRSL